MIPQDVGALLLRTEPFTYLDSPITFTEETDISRNSTLGTRNHAVEAAAKSVPGAMFQPRPRKAGIGARKKANFTAASIPRKAKAGDADASGNGPVEPMETSAAGSSAASTGPKGQDDFRKMLLEGKK